VPRTLITGITGQTDPTWENFTAKGYEVFGMVRGTVQSDNPNSRGSSIRLLERELRDLYSLIGVLETAQPDEIYRDGNSPEPIRRRSLVKFAQSEEMPLFHLCRKVPLRQVRYE